MVRESLDPSSRHASVVLQRRTSGFQHRFLKRQESGGRSSRQSHETYGDLDLWLRLERQGDVILGMLSEDGANWTPADSIELPDLASAVFVGLASAYRLSRDGPPSLATVCNVTLVGPQSEFLRADCNGDGTVDISDPVCTLKWLFVGEATPGCIAATNTNGDAEVNIADPVSVLNYLFGAGPAPVDPFPDCGPGELAADAALGCANPPNCQ